jgi:hypothetical protein
LTDTLDDAIIGIVEELEDEGWRKEAIEKAVSDIRTGLESEEAPKDFDRVKREILATEFALAEIIFINLNLPISIDCKQGSRKGRNHFCMVASYGIRGNRIVSIPLPSYPDRALLIFSLHSDRLFPVFIVI